MMYLLLSIILFCSCNAFAHSNKLDIPLAMTQETVATKPTPEIDSELDAKAPIARVVVPIAKEIDLHKHAQIYKKLLHDLDNLDNEDFTDESLRETVRTLLQDQIAVTKKVLEQEAPELAAQVEEEYSAPRKRLIIIGTVAVLVVGASILALFSYDPVTGTWGKPRTANAKATFARVIDKFSHAFDEAPSATAPVPTPATQPA